MKREFNSFHAWEDLIPLKIYIYLFFRERVREGKREREKHWCLLYVPWSVTNPKPRHVFQPGIELVTFCFVGWHLSYTGQGPHSFYYSPKKYNFPLETYFYFNRIFIHFTKKYWFLFEFAHSIKPFRSVILRVRTTFLLSSPGICQDAWLSQVSVHLCWVNDEPVQPTPIAFSLGCSSLITIIWHSSCVDFQWSDFTI